MFKAFRSYDDVIARERLIASRYEHVKYESIGSTAENREIGALFIGRPDAEKVFIKTGTLHAREWIAPMSTLFTAEVFASILGDGSRYPDVQVRCQSPPSFLLLIEDTKRESQRARDSIGNNTGKERTAALE